MDRTDTRSIEAPRPVAIHPAALLMLLRLVILFTLVPMVELAILIRLGQAISLGPTLAIIISTGVVGAALARHQGLKTLTHIQKELSAGVLPAGAMIDGLLILIAAALLVTPGLLTDMTGFLLLVPLVRRRVRARLRRYFETRITVVHAGVGRRAVDDDTFVDVEAEEVSGDRNELPR